MATVGVVARFTIHAEKAEEFARVANEWLVSPSQQEAGCIRYELWHDNEDPSLFAMVEEWESDADSGRAPRRLPQPQRRPQHGRVHGRRSGDPPLQQDGVSSGRWLVIGGRW